MATFATWNPSDKSTNITLSNGNLSAAPANSGDIWVKVRSTVSVSTGKWYWELTYTTFSSGSSGPGIANSSAVLQGDTNNMLGQNDANGFSLYAQNPTSVTYFNGSAASYGGAVSNGDVIGVALDATARTLQFYVNGVAKGVITLASNLTSPALFAGFSTDYNAGNGGAVTANFGASAFAYTVPSGYNPGLYTGSIGTNWTKTLTETSTFTDIILKGATKLLSQSLTYTDTFSRLWTLGRTLTEAVTNTATLIKTAGKVLLEAVSYLDTFIEGLLNSAGFNLPTVGANSGSGTAWGNPTAIQTGTDATFAFTSGAPSKYLLGNAFGFSIPSGATISGIQIQVRHVAPDGPVGGIVVPFKGGIAASSPVTGIDPSGGAVTTTDTYGSPTSLWGETWTPSDINDSAFGAALQQPSNGSDQWSVFWVKVKVFYFISGNSYSQTYTDAVTATDTLIKMTTKALLETATNTASTIRTVTRAFVETASTLDTVLKGTGRTLADSFTSSDTFIGLRTKAATLTETVTYIDTQIRAIVRAFVETVTNTATFTGFKATIGTFADSFTSTDTLIKSPGKVLSEAVTYTTSLIRSIGRLLTESATMADVVTGLRARVSTLTEAFNAADSLISAITRPLIEAVTYTDVISSTKVFFRTLTESATLTASLIKTAGRNLSETVASGDVFARMLSASRVFTETVTYSAVFRLLKNGSATIWRNVQKNTASLTNAVKHVASLSTVSKHISTWRNKDKS